MPAVVGWLLLAPAGVLLLISYVWPTLKLLSLSLSSDAIPGWNFLASGAYLRQLAHALSYALLPLLILGLVAPAVAWLAARSGLIGRWLVRAALVLPLAGFAPTGLALLFISRQRGPSTSEHHASSALMEWDGRIALVATMGTFLLAVGVTCYLTVFRGRQTPVGAQRAVLTVGGLLAILTLGGAVQQYTFPYLTGMAPGNHHLAATPMSVLHSDVRWAPVAVSILLILAALGLLAGALVLRSGLSLEFEPTVRGARDTDPGSSRRLPLLGALVIAVGLVALTVIQLGPWLSALASGDGLPSGRYPVISVFLTTWLIPLGTAVVQVGFAALAGLGIAVARPLGDRSEWLLLGFAPWLLVGNGLLELPQAGSEAELRTLLGSAPPSWISIMGIFGFTLLFRGQYARLRGREKSGGLGRLILLPALPMFVLGVGVTWLVQAQDLLVASLMDAGRGVVAHAQLLLVRDSLLAVIKGGTPDAALGYPLWMLVLFGIGALVLQWGFLDRISLRVALRPDPGP